jgi:hypothetical protein
MVRGAATPLQIRLVPVLAQRVVLVAASEPYGRQGQRAVVRRGVEAGPADVVTPASSRYMT